VAFEELKQRQSVMWGAGEYQGVTETIPDVHDLVLERTKPQPGERWLDLACGTGAVAERAARAGAVVTGIDFAPGLIEIARRRADELGLDIDYRVGDAENLEDVEDASFDIVSSTFGIMFAPDQKATARELGRITRNGGRLALANWDPTGSVADMFAMTATFAPPPAPGAGNPFDWGNEDRVRELLGDLFDLRFEKHVSTHEFESGEAAWQLFSNSFGPTKTIAASLDDERREEFHRVWVDFFETRFRTNGSVAHAKEYLLVLGTKR
jgi:SAM-dependent methyltransferase